MPTRTWSPSPATPTCIPTPPVSVWTPTTCWPSIRTAICGAPATTTRTSWPSVPAAPTIPAGSPRACSRRIPARWTATASLSTPTRL